MKEKVKNRIHKGMTIALYVIFILLAVTVAVLLYGKFTGKTMFLGSKTVLYVQTNSMEPTIPQKSYILVEKAKGEEIKVGDIITFVSDDPKIMGALNTHRVTSLDEKTGNFVTQGDNNPAADSVPARKEAVVGRFVKTLPAFTKIMNTLLSGTGIICMFVLFALLTFLCYLPDILEIAKKKEKPSEKGELPSMDKEELDRLVKLEVERLKKEKDGGTTHVQEDESEKKDQ